MTLRITLGDAAIIGISSAAGAGDSEPTEAVTIGFSTLTVEDTENSTTYTYDWTTSS